MLGSSPSPTRCGSVGVVPRSSLALVALAVTACRPNPAAGVAPTPATVAAQPPVVPATESEPHAEPQPEPQPEEAARDLPIPDPTPAPTRARRFDPTATPGTTVTLRLSFATVRGHDLAAPIAKAFAALDSARYFRDEQIDPTRDFDEVTLAAHDFRDPRNEVVVVHHRLGRAALRSALERAAIAAGDTIHWSENGSEIRGDPRPTDPGDIDLDPRKLVLPDERKAIYALEELLAAKASKAKSGTNASFLAASLVRAKPRRRAPASVLQLVVTGLTPKLGKGLPFGVPSRVEITLSAITEPEIVLKVAFPAADEARAFEDFWRGDLRGMIERDDSTRLALLATYETSVLTRNATQVRARTPVPTARLVGWFDGIALVLKQ